MLLCRATWGILISNRAEKHSCKLKWVHMVDRGVGCLLGWNSLQWILLSCRYYWVAVKASPCECSFHDSCVQPVNDNDRSSPDSVWNCNCLLNLCQGHKESLSGETLTALIEIIDSRQMKKGANAVHRRLCTLFNLFHIVQGTHQRCRRFTDLVQNIGTSLTNVQSIQTPKQY